MTLRALQDASDSDGDDVREIALLLIHRHGLRAPSYARLQGLRARYHGDEEAASSWRAVAEKALEILRTHPEDPQRG